MAAVARPLNIGPAARFRVPWSKVVAAATVAILLYLAAVPLVMIAFSSVRAAKDKLPFEATTFTLANYVSVFASSATYRLLLNTLWYGLGTLVLSFVIAAVFAWFLERGRAPARSALVLLVLAPLATPPVTDAVAWALMANPSTGVLNVALRSLLGLSGQGPLNVYSLPGMILVTALKFVPSLYIMISGPLARFDPSLEEASLTSKVSPLATLRRVTFPLLRPTLLAAFVYFLITVFEVFEIPAVLGLPKRIFVFSTLIYYATHPTTGFPDYGLVSVYAVIFVAVAGVLIYVYGRVVRHGEQFVVVTGKGYRPRLIDFGRWKWLLVGLIILYFLLSVLLPLFGLVWSSLGLTYHKVELASLSLANLNAYRHFLQSAGFARAVANTVVIATSAATASMLLATMASWLSTRSTFRGAALADRLTILAVGTPSVVTAIALTFFYIWIPLPIFGTIWIIVIALSTRFLGYSTRLMGSAHLQIHKELEEASLASGVSELRTLRRIVLPLLWPSFARGWLWVFVHSMRDTAIAVMLFTVTNDTIGARLWMTWFSDGNVGQASGIAVLLALASIALSFVIARLTSVRSLEF